MAVGGTTRQDATTYGMQKADYFKRAEKRKVETSSNRKLAMQRSLESPRS